MDGDTSTNSSQLFLVRLWLDEGSGDGAQEVRGWHGKVQHVVTGKAGKFDSQDALVDLLRSLASHQAASGLKQGQDVRDGEGGRDLAQGKDSE